MSSKWFARTFPIRDDNQKTHNFTYKTGKTQRNTQEIDGATGNIENK